MKTHIIPALKVVSRKLINEISEDVRKKMH